MRPPTGAGSGCSTCRTSTGRALLEYVARRHLACTRRASSLSGKRRRRSRTSIGLLLHAGLRAPSAAFDMQPLQPFGACVGRLVGSGGGRAMGWQRVSRCRRTGDARGGRSAAHRRRRGCRRIRLRSGCGLARAEGRWSEHRESQAGGGDRAAKLRCGRRYGRHHSMILGCLR